MSKVPIMFLKRCMVSRFVASPSDDIVPGEFVVVRGAQGSGESTLLNIVGCLGVIRSCETSSMGIDYVLVNSEIVIERDVHTGRRPEHILYGSGPVRLRSAQNDTMRPLGLGHGKPGTGYVPGQLGRNLCQLVSATTRRIWERCKREASRA